jgi:hypothetical protein
MKLQLGTLGEFADNFLISHIKGGLGNQMFKLAAAYKVSKVLNKKLLIDLNWYKNQKNNPKLNFREYELDFFTNITSLSKFKFEELAALEKYTYLKYKYLKKSQSMLNDRNYTKNLIFDFSRIRFINGNFEDLQFLPDEKTIKHLFQFSNRKNYTYEKMLTETIDDNSVAIHIRLGDYVNYPSIYNILDVSYYTNSLEIARSKVGKIKVSLFSDDPISSIKFLEGKIKIDFIHRYDGSLKAPEVLELMSNHRAIITSNSTFSWWAGYLGYLNKTCHLITIPSNYYSNLEIQNNLKFEACVVVPSNSKLI